MANDNKQEADCPICAARAEWHTRRDDYDFFECSVCESLFIDPATIAHVDAGHSLVNYSDSYWQSELQASRMRSFGSSMARISETFLYARRPIDVFLDIGTGPGFLLDACATYLPAAASKFFGVEKYPPTHGGSLSPNLIIGDLADLRIRVDAGSCIEVIEHLTPKMVTRMFAAMSSISNDGALYIFNSGQPKFVKTEDPGYLDPCGRGHLISYSLSSIAQLAEPYGFRVHALPGKTWAFMLEKTDSRTPENILDRIWTPDPANVATLHDPLMGSVMYILALETARAYS